MKWYIAICTVSTFAALIAVVTMTVSIGPRKAGACVTVPYQSSDRPHRRHQ